MRIIGVIDILAGQTVAARKGQRETYQPIQSSLCSGSDPRDVAAAFAIRGIDEIYVADLDRIGGRAANVTSWNAISQVARTMWLDVGIRDAKELSTLRQQFASCAGNAAAQTTTICASESWDDILHVSDEPNTASTRRAFSLDLRQGILDSPIAQWQTLPVIEVAKELVDAGWNQFVVLDLAAVGAESGCPTVSLCQTLRTISDDIEIVTGGGIRCPDDLLQLEDAGCDAALVSTALHKGHLP